VRAKKAAHFSSFVVVIDVCIADLLTELVAANGAFSVLGF